jgi:hypothetical protein
MSTVHALKDKKVSELTVKELQGIIKDTIVSVINPDYGLELRPEIIESLKKSLKSKKRYSVEQVAKELGLKW